MRITRIEIINYRQYQELTFEFPKKCNNDLHVIIAQNGVGKTNLLNAITWCLYGKEPHLGDQSSERGLPKLNLAALEKARSEGLDNVYVEVSIYAEENEDCIIFKRRLPVRVSSDVFEHRDEFSVSVVKQDGDSKIYENDSAQLQVDRYMPEKIREYFFFDGEQLNDYLVSERHGQIREAIFSISQVDILNRIHKRIGDIITAKQREAGIKAPNIRRITDDLSTCREQIQDLSSKISDIEAQISISNQIIIDNTEYLRGQENLPELEETYQNLRTRQQNLESDQNALTQHMFVFVREMKVGLACYLAAQRVLAIIDRKERENALPPNIDKSVLLDMLHEHKCTICQRTLTPDEEMHIGQLIQQLQVSSETSNLLMSIRSELERLVDMVEKYPTEKKNLIDSQQSLGQQIKKVEIELQDLENRLSRLSDKEQVRLRHQERKKHEELRNTNLQRLGVAKQQLETENGKKAKLESDLSKALAREKECSRIRQLICFADEGRQVIGSIEKEMMEEVREKMERRTTQYFNRLLWKKNTYDRIVLNEDYKLDLFHVDGYSCIGTCSAAERCLLALSFTLALHEVSGFNTLLFIDTPVARVSDTNRANFAQVLCEVSLNKQIIMTFTPDEYSSEISKEFNAASSTHVELYLEDEKVVVVK